MEIDNDRIRKAALVGLGCAAGVALGIALGYGWLLTIAAFAAGSYVGWQSHKPKAKVGA